MININYDLLHSFMRCRQVNGIPTAVDILTRIAKSKKSNHWWKAIAIGAIGGIVVNHMSWRGWR